MRGKAKQAGEDAVFFLLLLICMTLWSVKLNVVLV
jgi:hypothetical protein